jgi:DNA-binding NtrC family response regulator
MKSSQNTLIISDNIQLVEELKRLLQELEVKHIQVAKSGKEAICKFFDQMPAFTFLDMNSESIQTSALAKVIERSEATKLTLIYRSMSLAEELLTESDRVCVIKKPITITKLNDIINPDLSFANLLEEARMLVSQESDSQEWQ